MPALFRSRVLAVLAAISLPSASPAQECDVLIRGGRVLDGTGTPWRAADVAIQGDRIVAVGRLAGARAVRVIDATGLWVAPGFVDVHTHAGPALARAETAAAVPLLTQGITTAFVNHDGGGPADLAAQRRAIEAQRPGVNVAQLIGHHAARTTVLGNRDVQPTPEQQEQMNAIVRQAFAAGAFGLSAGPFYAPGSFSRVEEHVALARVAAEFDGVYASHVRDEGDYGIGVVAAVDELIRVAREARLPGIITHIKVLGPGVWGKSAEIIRRVEAARAEGIEVYADQYPYEASATGLAAALVPSWALDGGAGALRARLGNPEQRARIRPEMVANLARRAGAAAIQIRSYGPDPSLEGRRLDAIARDRLADPVDVAMDLIRGGEVGIVSFIMQESDIRAFMVQPWTMTCSDGELLALGQGAAHPRSYGPYPRKLRKYVVEDQVLPLERAIQSMTGLPASVMRLRDRGVIRPGAFADVAIFDLAAVRDRATYEQPHQVSEGMRFVFVNGVAALAEGRVTAERAGRVLSRQRP